MKGKRPPLRTDTRSKEAQAYRSWYKTSRWQRLRYHQLQSEPLCRMCQQIGRITAATICDHINQHKGDEALFWSGPFQSLCKQHHDSAKQSQERTGKAKPPTGVDGWPMS